MPLSAAADRRPIHTRRIACQGYLRDDGMWDFEGRLSDTKTYPFESEWRGDVAAGEAIHDMLVRLTVDENFIIRGVEACSDSTPYPPCQEVPPTLSALVGESIGHGWSRTVRKLVGGRGGCTHMTELLGRMGTVCFQTIYPYRAAQRGEEARPKEPLLMNSCHAYRDDGPLIAKHYPEHHVAAGD
jgi:hypothetical protein